VFISSPFDMVATVHMWLLSLWSVVVWQRN
jgi:hypothetical protein